MFHRVKNELVYHADEASEPPESLSFHGVVNRRDGHKMNMNIIVRRSTFDFSNPPDKINMT
jgi:hypothetical protein